MKTLSMMGDRKVNAMTRARENYKQAKKVRASRAGLKGWIEDCHLLFASSCA